ncbi:MAG: AEC family transporter [Anaerolineales bacterium]|nr:AEC family transporter [Anaerolineales bacterium]
MAATLALYWGIFYSNLVPTLLAAGAGYVLGRRLQPDVRSISRLTFYLFSPCLVFISLSQSNLAGPELAQVALVAWGTIVTVILTAFAIGRAAQLAAPTIAALATVSAFGNAGNFGLAVTRFAFGEVVLAPAAVFFAFSSVAVYTVGVAVASAGRRPWRDVLRHGLTLPTTYALVVAIIFEITRWPIPEPVTRATTLLSQGAIPVMLSLLGMQIAQVKSWPRSRLALVGVAALLQLLFSPLVATLLAGALGLAGPTRQAVILESAMPTAVIVTILSTEYDLDPALAGAAVLVTTLLSPLTLTPLIAYLQR